MADADEMLEQLLRNAAMISGGTAGSAPGVPTWGGSVTVPGFLPMPTSAPMPQYAPPLPPVQWPDNTLIREMLVRMDKELAEALKLLLKRLDKIDEVVGRIEQAGRYSS